MRTKDNIPSPVPHPSPGAVAPPISREIYGMPMFATLQVTDVERTISWYVDGLGLVSLFTLPGPNGPVLVHLRRWVDRRQDVIGWCRRPGRRWDRPALWDGPCPR